jgi:hypothetical protein
MLIAQCTYRMHLDMNPHHTGFVFARIRSVAPLARSAPFDAAHGDLARALV